VTWLVRDGDVLATTEVARSAKARRTGLLGRGDLDGALLIRPCRSVHTLGMRFPIDVAFCDAGGRVLHTSTLRPWRVSRIVLRSAFVVEASAGSFDRWALRPGDQLELRG
jgi:uncharacterized membrane protein (UPF0127 family)